MDSLLRSSSIKSFLLVEQHLIKVPNSWKVKCRQLRYQEGIEFQIMVMNVSLYSDSTTEGNSEENKG